ncbi:MAG: radical SAM protein [Promethearchaeota archaeon]|nr:radical SAM protein [Candidatus Lokiarchaeota archaeon]TET58443.1 MAG: radical SAM protein [Candidatus Lokiarchaeota archaeon]
MKKINLTKSEEETYFIKGRSIPKGCKYCLKGSKAVLFLNGICQKPDHCSWYCPISEERRDKDVTFADEIEIITKEELLKEIKMINAQGMSITGGEPLSEINFEKTLDYIKYVKLNKGRKFHIHLYTNGIDFNENKADKLSMAGLDEIRFHPAKEHWVNIEKALNKKMKVGAELPVIPEKEEIETLEKLIIYLNTIGADFINLNEFEYCFPNSQALKERGFQLKNGSIASVINSQETGLDLIRKIGAKVSIKMHLCSIRAKDYYQLKNRYIRRAKNIKLPYEVITEEGLLVFGQIEGDKKELDKFYKNLLFNLRIQNKFISYDEKNIKIPFYISIKGQVLSILEKYQLKGFIVETTPFRLSKYQQITEKTPIELFKEEYGFNGN